jgi:hypothetical protein
VLRSSVAASRSVEDQSYSNISANKQVAEWPESPTIQVGNRACCKSLLQENGFRSNFVLRSTRPVCLCCTEVATDGACSAGELCDRGTIR